MTTAPLTLHGDLITASDDGQTLTYRLLTFGEPGRTNVGTLVAEDPSAVTVPDDVSSLVVNVEHDRKRPAARFQSITRSPDGAGLDATLRCLPTSVGHDMYVEASEGVRPGISVELANATIRNGRLIRSDLVAAGFVTAPAFPSSLVMAADVGPDVAEASRTAADALNALASTIEATGETSPEDPTATPNPAKETPAVTASATVAPTATPVLGTVQTIQQVPRVTAAETGPSFREVMRLLGQAEDNPTAEVLAALSDIKVSGTGAVGVAALETGWLGELWSGRNYQRRYIPLASRGSLTTLTSVGWRWLVAPEVDDWAGNKTAVPSNAPTTESVPSTAKRLAGAHDVDRAYRDFNVVEFWDSYFRAMTESYARKSDLRALSAYIAGATPVTGEGTLADTTVWSMLIDGAIAVLAGGGVPTSAVVGLDLYRSALLTPKDEVIALLSSTLGLESGSLAGFSLVPAPDAATLPGQVLVQDQAAVTFKELGGEAPIRVEGLDMVKGGVDPGVFGYYDVIVNNADAIAVVSKPAGA